MGAHHGQILRILRDEGPQSRAALARRSKLSATTLTHVTAHLLRDGSVLESETSGSIGVGRPAQAVRLVPDAHSVAGVHIGAGHVQVAITDLKAAPKATASFEFDVHGADPDRVVSDVAAMVMKLAAEVQIDTGKLLGIGVGVPGPVDFERRTALASINVGWRNVPIAGKLERAIRLPTVVEHNVTAMALAESCYGIGRQVPALLFVYLKTGLGAGLVVDGVPFRPGGHGAVELGHIQITPDGARCACGNRGCLETFLCEKALMAAAGVIGSAPADLMARVEQNGPAWDTVIEHLTTALASAVNLLTPDLIVFGGYLGQAPESLFERLRADVPPRVMPHMREILKFERTSFGAQSGAIGGAAVALDHFFYSGALH
ncbi:ROK family transcriptional regulator [Mesorhizobium sp. Root554]|uniref:ROK family transcriptional regulator n=1 Tax=unclassified Mesorhizobium TaxID=325217 RepID=UPI0006FDFD88|nr:MULTISPECIES: ROK family transcriptional regulator [unclassified Mesorhizobium]KQZ14154.1 ROK family transcriptional regulator [Mesorhizobium sp. Root1471]KQZ36666.1 ROK family transcriptional regulator [Mesorhizobium sp. Root554]